MIAAVEVPIEKAVKDRRFQYFIDARLNQRVSEMLQVGHELPTFLVLSNGVSLHYRKGMCVYRKDQP